MAARGHVPFEGRSIQAPGMMRHGPFPGGLGPATHHRTLEPLPPPELLENKIAAQAAEMERLVRENQRLAGTHVALRQELIATQKEMQRIQAHVGSFQAEGDIQVRGLLEKIGKMETDIRAADMVKKDLQQAHIEAQSLITARQELTTEIQVVTEELQKANADVKRLPDLHAELDGLRQEHQKLRAAFEYEKSSNMEQVEQMRGLEKNLISMAREVEKLRADVTNAEKGATVANPYSAHGTYNSPDPTYPSAGPAGGYMGSAYGHGSIYSNAGYGHGGPAIYTQAYGNGAAGVSGGSYSYGRPQPPASGAMASSGAGYSDGYGRLQVQMTGSGPLEASNAMNPYNGASGVNGTQSQGAARGSSTA